ncbi:MAG TPA: DNA mismatch repair endonuclease MutL [Anaerolineaceae bacterium]|nr:DNA mismatch repair endonuclease MutL [Anaerolineaceae bacterium]
MSINILPDEVASQIAAGEVVERPASVVKELLENTIDAGADRIVIRVEEAGRKLIEVSDNGAGIPTAELSLAVARHATSKLRSAEDLFRIRTLGFRGEALASIGSVSRMVIQSRQPDQTAGAKIVIDGGKTISQEPAGGIPGTLIQVRDLFYNTPARLKFLKRDLTEKQQIDGLVTRYALAYSDKAIHLSEDGKPVLQTAGDSDRRAILAQLHGSELARQLLEVVFEEDGIRIDGFISPISINRSNRKDITFFVNGRWVQDTALITALMKAYQSFLMVGRYPMAVLFLEITPEDVDVNVHPAKAEVRFRQPDAIFTSVQRAVRRALMSYSPVPQISPTYWHTGTEHAYSGNPGPSWDQISQRQSLGGQYTGVDQPEKGTEQPLTPLLMDRIPILRLVGQIGATYLVAEGPDGLYLIDQHAAHERVLFEKMLAMKGNIPSQSLLEPLIVQLPPQSARQLQENLPVMQMIGFHLEEFGVNTFRLTAIPAVFAHKDPRAAIRSVVEDFEEDETPLQGMLEEKLIARICKRMAVKGGAVLSMEEQQALVQDLEACSAPRTCPHGRPTMIHLSVDLLERQFGRRGARSS